MTSPIHIRRQYPRNCGNSRYRDRRTFTDGAWLTHTYCGAEVTDRDLAYRDRHSRWTRDNACPACLAQLDIEQPTKNRSTR